MSAKTAPSVARTPAPPSGPVYVDTSALLKLYLPEPESDALERWLVGRRDVVTSDLSLTEATSAVARRRREGSIDSATAAVLHTRMLSDIQGIFRRLELVPETHRVAERLLLSLDHTPLRALDALHLALAVQGGCQMLVTYDARLAAASRASGLPVHP